MMQHVEVLRRLEDEIELTGSLRRTASHLSISPQYLSAVLAGKRTIGKKLLKALRLRRTVVKTVTYQEIKRHA